MKSVLATVLPGEDHSVFLSPGPVQNKQTDVPLHQESLQRGRFSSRALTEPLIIGVAGLFVHKIAAAFSHTPAAQRVLPSLPLGSRDARGGGAGSRREGAGIAAAHRPSQDPRPSVRPRRPPHPAPASRRQGAPFPRPATRPPAIRTARHSPHPFSLAARQRGGPPHPPCRGGCREM